MKYRVELADSFTADLDRHLAYLQQEKVAPVTIGRWLGRLHELVLGLDELPKRHPVDPHFTQSAGTTTRKVNLGNYLIFYQIDDEHRRVTLVAFTHGAARKDV
ncbi:type II toxin-antitoxin system RelE/ParE family toxin [Phycisphaeraceae bacterium D3-23]